jgi:cobalt-zinc-cadmium efflux system membrane fusion protein
MLGGVMLLGHFTDWKMPKFSELVGAGTTAADDWCTSHLVPESFCIECAPNLLPKSESFGFCNLHGVAECVIDHPELAQTNTSPSLPKYDTAAAITLINRPANNSTNSLNTHRVQFTSHESVVKAGVGVDVVGEGQISDFVTANGELVFDPNRVASLSSKIPGTVTLVLKKIGDTVLSGEILALVDASQVGLLKSELLKNVSQLQLQKDNVERLTPLAVSRAISTRDLLEAKTAFQEAEVALLSTCQMLTNLGFEIPDDIETADSKTLAAQLRFLNIPEPLVEALPPGMKTANLIPIRSPFDGVLISSDIVVGNVVETSKPLFTVCDVSKIWIMLNVRQEDAKYVQTGLTVKFRSDDGDHNANGVIAWISPFVDQQTRMLKVRAEIDNPNGLLIDKTYGSGQIVIREEANAILVPKEAVQSTPDARFVFVRDKNYFDDKNPKFFHVRQVRVGAVNGKNVELLAGVLPGEVVATTGSNVLLAHLLRANLGAGCCAED